MMTKIEKTAESTKYYEYFILYSAIACAVVAIIRRVHIYPSNLLNDQTYFAWADSVLSYTLFDVSLFYNLTGFYE